MAHTKTHTKKTAANRHKKRPLTGAAKASVDFAGGKEHGGWSVRLVKEGLGYAVHIKRGSKRSVVRGSKAKCDAAFLDAVVNAKG